MRAACNCHQTSLHAVLLPISRVCRGIFGLQVVSTDPEILGLHGWMQAPKGFLRCSQLILVHLAADAVDCGGKDLLSLLAGRYQVVTVLYTQCIPDDFATIARKQRQQRSSATWPGASLRHETVASLVNAWD
jgi:hypothetical protein